MGRRATTARRTRVVLRDAVGAVGLGETADAAPTLTVHVAAGGDAAPASRVCAALAAAASSRVRERYPLDDLAGCAAAIAGQLARLGIESKPARLPLGSAADEWLSVVEVQLEDHGVTRCLQSWIALLATAGDSDPAIPPLRLDWVTDDAPVLAELALRLFELPGGSLDHRIVTTHEVWVAVRDYGNIVDRLDLEAAPPGPRTPLVHLRELAYHAVLAERAQLAAPDTGRPRTATAELEPASDRARSAAESFLFEVLELRDATRGVFALNHSLEFTFGSRPCEADLCAADERVVIEVDGYYHFLAPDAWRRDRRKDLALQLNGYTVLRCLAEDVVEHLETLLEQIDTALAHSRSRSP